MNDTKRIGRPRTFNTDEALLAAMNVFWKKGYDGASLKDLTLAMGISGPSMYAAFGDKRELYLKTIDLYSNVDGCAPIISFEAEPDIEKAVIGFLEAVIDYATIQSEGTNGCFLASCVSTSVGEVEGVKERMVNAINETDSRLAARFDAEKEKGRLPENFPSKERARLMFDMRQGYVFRGRTGASAQTLKEDLVHRAKMIVSK
ncbi:MULTISPECIES: TetR/AcrR family transcriptional regulator [unclassified Pseudoalteromonas]|uniref:TetR/AcrR family transcriptional regulator n=1 Tax=unclassified Pseudoalteromonas TaxID=194690 RepID=UPI001E6060E0|nr:MULTISPECIES: TetR/AcrR family transcriptional regulator [unclassified Pseudoalteromonas]